MKNKKFRLDPFCTFEFTSEKFSLERDFFFSLPKRAFHKKNVYLVMKFFNNWYS